MGCCCSTSKGSSSSTKVQRLDAKNKNLKPQQHGGAATTRGTAASLVAARLTESQRQFVSDLDQLVQLAMTLANIMTTSVDASSTAGDAAAIAAIARAVFPSTSPPVDGGGGNINHRSSPTHLAPGANASSRRPSRQSFSQTQGSLKSAQAASACFWRLVPQLLRLGDSGVRTIAYRVDTRLFVTILSGLHTLLSVCVWNGTALTHKLLRRHTHGFTRVIKSSDVHDALLARVREHMTELCDEFDSSVPTSVMKLLTGNEGDEQSATAINDGGDSAGDELSVAARAATTQRRRPLAVVITILMRSLHCLFVVNAQRQVVAAPVSPHVLNCFPNVTFAGAVNALLLAAWTGDPILGTYPPSLPLRYVRALCVLADDDDGSEVFDDVGGGDGGAVNGRRIRRNQVGVVGGASSTSLSSSDPMSSSPLMAFACTLLEPHTKALLLQPLLVTAASHAQPQQLSRKQQKQLILESQLAPRPGSGSDNEGLVFRLTAQRETVVDDVLTAMVRARLLPGVSIVADNSITGGGSGSSSVFAYDMPHGSGGRYDVKHQDEGASSHNCNVYYELRSKQSQDGSPSANKLGAPDSSPLSPQMRPGTTLTIRGCAARVLSPSFMSSSSSVTVNDVEAGTGHGPRKELFHLLSQQLTERWRPLPQLARAAAAAAASAGGCWSVTGTRGGDTIALTAPSSSPTSLNVSFARELKVGMQLTLSYVVVATSTSDDAAAPTTPLPLSSTAATPARETLEVVIRKVTEQMTSSTATSMTVSLTVDVRLPHTLRSASTSPQQPHSDVRVTRVCAPNIQLLEYRPSSACYFPNTTLTDSVDARVRYVLLGWLLGASLLNRAPLATRVADVILAQVCARDTLVASVLAPSAQDLKQYHPQHSLPYIFTPTLAHLADLDPQLEQQLRRVLVDPASTSAAGTISDRDFASLCEAEGMPAPPTTTRETYVCDMLNRLLVEDVRWQVNAMRRGMWTALGGDATRVAAQPDAVAGRSGALLRHYSLSSDNVCVLTGADPLSAAAAAIDVPTLFRVRYDEDERGHHRWLVHALWTVLKTWSHAQRRQFLTFVTGVPFTPVPRSEELVIEFPHFAIGLEEQRQQVRLLPQAHTCSNTIELVDYLEVLDALETAGDDVSAYLPSSSSSLSSSSSSSSSPVMYEYSLPTRDIGKDDNDNDGDDFEDVLSSTSALLSSMDDAATSTPHSRGAASRHDEDAKLSAVCSRTRFQQICTLLNAKFNVAMTNASGYTLDAVGDGGVVDGIGGGDGGGMSSLFSSTSAPAPRVSSSLVSSAFNTLSSGGGFDRLQSDSSNGGEGGSSQLGLGLGVPSPLPSAKPSATTKPLIPTLVPVAGGIANANTTTLNKDVITAGSSKATAAAESTASYFIPGQIR